MAEAAPEYVRRLTKLIADHGMSQADLAAIADLDQSTISHYLSGRREPTKFASLIFAGLSKTSDDRAFWLATAALRTQQLELLTAATRVTAVEDNEEEYSRQLIAAFLEFWNHPQGVVRENLKDLMQSMIFEHLPPRKTR